MTAHEAMIALNMLPGIGPVRVRHLLSALGGAESVLRAGPKQLLSVQGIGPETASVIADWESRIDLTTELQEAESRGVSILTRESESFPTALGKMYDPPLALYVWGELTEADGHTLGVVGSRRCSHYGMKNARQFAFQLATAGFTIVSGLARGIDTHAHEGAIAAKGRTLAVIGSGLGQIYPSENIGLAERIADGFGAVVSEFPIHTPPSKKAFPMRNRIVAAWSQAILVVECPEWSGALITANLAGDLGRSLYAVPGQIDRPSMAGCHRLIREGATLVTSGQEILDDLSMLPLQENLEAGGAEMAGGGVCGKMTLPCSESASQILAALEQGDSLIDELLISTALALPELNATLLKLEITGRVMKLPGGRVLKK